MIGSEHIEAIWKRYYARLLAFVESRVAGREEAEDILQEVFLRLHTRICCVQAWETMERLVYRITRNLIIDRYRRGGRTVALGEDLAAAGGSPGPDDDPAAVLAFSLRETVEELPEPYRRSLIATEYEGITQAELASREGISLSAAKSRVQRGRAKLKEALLDCCHFELDVFGRVIDYQRRCRCCRGVAVAPRAPRGGGE